MEKKKSRHNIFIKGIPVALADLELLAGLHSSSFYPSLERLYQKILKKNKDLSFKLRENDPDFMQKHRSLSEQTYGIWLFLEMVREASSRIGKEED